MAALGYSRIAMFSQGNVLCMIMMIASLVKGDNTTASPTVKPTGPCINIYDYCDIVAANGYCYHDDQYIRFDIQSQCPISCGTCFNTTIAPTVKPSMPPSLAPTAPTLTPTQTPPTDIPTVAPSTLSPTVGPTSIPTSKPSMVPTIAPTTSMPTMSPPTGTPTASPSTLAPSVGPTVKPTDSPSRRPSLSPTCGDNIGYCKLISTSCSSEHAKTKIYMVNNCAATCGFCSEAPTGAPTVKCFNRYDWCRDGALAGACTAKHHKARASFLHDCPVSCGTCHGKTLTPTILPTIQPTSEPTIAPTVKPSLNPSKQPTDNPTIGPTGAPTCQDLIDYCNFVKGSCRSAKIAERKKMQKECASTCGLCTLQPTVSPTAPCVDLYSYCPDLAMKGACYNNSDHEARMEFLSDCPLSCNTCHNQTVSPSSQPTLAPTGDPSNSPTMSPVCLDTVGYCPLLKDYCNSDELSIRTKLQEGCSSTCLFCKEGSKEHSAVGVGLNQTKEPTVPPTRAPQKVTRRVVTNQSQGSTDSPIVVGILSIVTVLAFLLLYVLVRSDKGLRLVRRYFNGIAHLEDSNRSCNK